MLPIVTRGTLDAKFAFWPYIERRFRRIYPPYLAALLLTVALIFVARRLFPDGEIANLRLSPGNFFSHLFLLHNLSPVWSRSLGNDPLWSVATEWQIYFLFPLVLLPVRRLAGRIFTIIAGLLIGWGALFASNFFLESGDPWLLGLFAMGMVGAELAFSSEPKTRAFCERMPWLTLTFVGSLILIVFRSFSERFFAGGFNRYQYIADPMFGLVAMALLLALSTGSKSIHKAIAGIFQSRVAMFLGRYSYSIYLVHFPLLHLIVDPLCQRWNFNLQQRIFAGLIYVPCALALTYIFHLCFKAPILNAKAKKSPAI